MFENFDFSKMSAMLEEAQKQAQKLQDDASSKQFVAKSGGGLVSVTLDGNSEVVDITIDDSLLSDKESMQILLISALNDALKMVEDNKKFATAQMFSGISGFGTKG